MSNKTKFDILVTLTVLSFVLLLLSFPLSIILGNFATVPIVAFTWSTYKLAILASIYEDKLIRKHG